MKAYSYSRFSSDAQRQGTSIERQQSLALKWSQDNNIPLSDDVFADEAVSGFHGDNLASGAFARFMRHVKAGDIERGSYLILENLDRLTRQDAWTASNLLQQLVELGITVVALRPSEIRFDQNSSAIDLLQAILYMDNAHKESARKSDLGKQEWGKRFAKARATNHHIGKRVSNWLTLDDDGVYRLNDKATTVQKIFALCLDGYGSTVIAQKLNAEGHKTFNKGQRWGTSAVLTILQSRAAIGELAPKDGGEPIADYFEAAVDRDTFDAAQAVINARKTGKVTKQAAEFNVWSKLVFCGACGSSMHIIQRTKFRYLMCANRRYGECLGSKNVRLDESEDIFMAVLLEMDAMGLVKPNTDQLERDLTVADGRLIAEREKLLIWADKLAQHPDSETFQRFVLQSEGRISALKREVERLKAELTGGERINWGEFKARIDLSDRNTRMRANAHLRRMGVQVHIAEGYLVTQHKDAKAMLVVAKSMIGVMSLEAGENDDTDRKEVPDAQAAHAIAMTVKNLLVEQDGGLVYRGMLTVPNGRGTRRSKHSPSPN